MEIPGQVTVEDAAVLIGAVLDRVDHARTCLVSPADLLESTVAWSRLAERAAAVQSALVGQVARVEASMIEAGTPVRSWLQATTTMSAKHARVVERRARLAGRFTRVAAAHLAGEMTTEAADAVLAGLAQLPDDLTGEQVDHGEQHLVDLATGAHGQPRLDPVGLRQCANRLVEVVAPEVADEALAKRLAREAAQAARDRHLTWTHDHHGSVFFKAKLPVADAETVIGVINAITNNATRAADQADPAAPPVSLGQRRADAFALVFARAAGAPDTPASGGVPPTVHVQLDHAALLAGLVRAKLIGSDTDLSAGEARRLACDAQLIPTVLGSHGQVLDVGRSVRLVPPRLRALLIARDGGCAFPGCDRTPADCDAHHIDPWWNHGPTDLANLVLLCRHHHGLVEPHPGWPDGAQWEVRINPADGRPEFLPPARLDPKRRPKRHTRHTKITITPPTGPDGGAATPHAGSEPRTGTTDQQGP
ncbi:DUF222 domain-containing protein [Microlunatus sp. Y2014]|uniref:HNH endonuclease signature motif containing protein n=2 Tax=Microlunatus sp. Y2014 TaxID=3418488 RepID=UPI003DA77D78